MKMQSERFEIGQFRAGFARLLQAALAQGRRWPQPHQTRIRSVRLPLLTAQQRDCQAAKCSGQALEALSSLSGIPPR